MMFLGRSVYEYKGFFPITLPVVSSKPIRHLFCVMAAFLLDFRMGIEIASFQVLGEVVGTKRSINAYR
jgi:hypothetical protein